MISIIGDIFGTTGYASHTKNLANAIYKQTETRLTTQLIPDWQRFVNDAELDMITKQEKENEINLIITMPQMWKLYTKQGRNWGYCIWEGDKVPESWIEDFLNLDIEYIFVASNHTKEAIINTIQKLDTNKQFEIVKKVKIIHHGVNLNLFYNNHTRENVKHKFRFLCNKGWRGTSWDRGGVQYLIKAFKEEFKKDEDVELIVKLNPAYINQQILQQAISNMNLPTNGANIQISIDSVPYNKLIELYNSCDVYICATRCDAFNLGGIEAMACGLSTIQTNFGGQTDYMTDKNSLYIDYKLEEVKEDMMYEGICWATLNIEDLKKKMRWAFEHQEDIKQMGGQAEQDAKQFTWNNSASKILELKGG